MTNGNEIDCLRELARRCGVANWGNLNQVEALRALAAKLGAQGNLNSVDALRYLTTGSSSGGVTNTGNAAVGDVATGKTFSSATLANATGTSTKNATVPNDAPILPPAAFVAVFNDLLNDTYPFQNFAFDFSNKGIESIGDEFLINLESLGEAHALVLNLSGNALISATVNSIFSTFPQAQPGTLNISGGTNATPINGATNSGVWSMAAQGWTLTFNLHSVPVSINNSVADFSGNSMSSSEVNALLAFLVASYPNLALTLNLSGGTTGAPTGQGLTDEATLVSNGWTVTTN